MEELRCGRSCAAGRPEDPPPAAGVGMGRPWADPPHSILNHERGIQHQLLRNVLRPVGIEDCSSWCTCITASPLFPYATAVLHHTGFRACYHHPHRVPRFCANAHHACYACSVRFSIWMDRPRRGGLLTAVAGVGIGAALGACVTMAILSSSRRRKRPVIADPKPPHNGLPTHQRIAVATRIHGQEASATKRFDGTALRDFLRSASTYADAILIAVEVGKLHHPNLVVAVEDVVKEFPGAPVHVIPVAPWGRFVPALNAALSFAASEGFEYILYQSLEVRISSATLDILKQAFDPEQDLVAGAALEGHEFTPGVHVLSGVTSPWNTLALWSVRKLGLTGFLCVSDGLLERACAGIEEVAAIALAQALRGEKGGAVAKVVKTDVKWEITWDDPKRREWHEKKVRGKVSRANVQLKALGLPDAYVVHVDG